MPWSAWPYGAGGGAEVTGGGGTLRLAEVGLRKAAAAVWRQRSWYWRRGDAGRTSSSGGWGRADRSFEVKRSTEGVPRVGVAVRSGVGGDGGGWGEGASGVDGGVRARQWVARRSGEFLAA
jgi:hypothetical protein